MTFDKFIKNNEKLIYKLAHDYHIEDYEFDDLVQEGLTKLWEVYKEYNEEYAMTTFITTVLNNHYNNLLKSTKVKKRQNYDDEGNEILDIKDYDFSVIANEQNVYSLEEQHTIDIGDRVLDEYKYSGIIEGILEGDTYRDIASEYGISHQRVYQIWIEYLELVKERL